MTLLYKMGARYLEEEMQMSFYNYLGNEISGIPRFSNISFGKYDEHGKPVVNWHHPSIINADEDGFDLTNVEENGE